MNGSLLRVTLKTAALVLAAAVIVLAGLIGPAFADKGGHGKGHGKDHGHDDDHGVRVIERTVIERDDDDSLITIIIGDDDRSYIREYIGGDYRRHCPPGLAKKNPACVPPGHAKKYKIGHRLPDDVVFVPVSGDLLMHLKPVPVGYQYVQVDKDVLLIGEASKKVIDAVTLLSAVGQ